MSLQIKRQQTDCAEIDVTSFMNLMIVLVPVLLMSMTFTRVSVLDVNLPELAGGSGQAEHSQSQLEVVVRSDSISVFYPAGQLIERIENGYRGYDYPRLTQVLKALKQRFAEQQLEKKDAVILLEKDLPYQTLVSTMDAVKSYRTVVVADVAEVELFPQVSLGDAPAKQPRVASNTTKAAVIQSTAKSSN